MRRVTRLPLDPPVQSGFDDRHLKGVTNDETQYHPARSPHPAAAPPAVLQAQSPQNESAVGSYAVASKMDEFLGEPLLVPSGCYEAVHVVSFNLSWLLNGQDVSRFLTTTKPR